MLPIEADAVEVYEFYKRKVRFDDEERTRGIRAILRLMTVEGLDKGTLMGAAKNYASEHSKRAERFRPLAKNFFSRYARGDDSEPLWSIYQPLEFDRFTAESAPQPPSTPSEPPSRVLTGEERAEAAERLRRAWRGEGV